MDDRKQKPAEGNSSGDAIDRNLKRVYDDMIEDDVPDRFADLLRQLREQGKSE